MTLQAGLLGYTTENVTMWTSQTIGGLVNATLGNMVELIGECWGLLGLDFA